MAEPVYDKEFYQLQQAIRKALITTEMPLKLKHVRAAIISTFNYQGAKVFWAISIRQPILDNQMVAWKFCHLLHKILQEGHSLCCTDSMDQRSFLKQCGDLWALLPDGYGLCIKAYTKLLCTKIAFHHQNPRFPCNLQNMIQEEMNSVENDDINSIFELTLEIFDYLDELIALQSQIWNSLHNCRINSMTLPGQCRLAPVVPIVEDSSALYNIAIQLMLKLHKTLPEDILTAHRDRFTKIHNQLKIFYSQAKEMQFLQNVITVPQLSDTIPKFQPEIPVYQYNDPHPVQNQQQSSTTITPTAPPSIAEYPPLISFDDF